MRTKVKQVFKSLSFRLKGYYRKKLITILLLASLPGIVMGIIAFSLSKTQMERELMELHQAHLYDTMNTIEDEFSYLEILIAHWAFDPKLTENLEDIDFVSKYKETHELYKTLLVIEGSNPLIGQVSLYMEKPTPVVLMKDRYKYLESAKEQRDYSSLLENKRSMYWSDSSVKTIKGRQSSNLRLIHKISGNDQKPNGALIVSLDHAKISNLLKSPFEKGKTFLFNDKGQWMFDEEKQSNPHKMDQSILEKVQQRKKSSDTFLFHWHGEAYSVTYESFFRLGDKWVYVSQVPLTSITSPVLVLFKMMIIVSALIFVLALLLSFIASKKLYSPIEQLLQKLNIQKHEGVSPIAINEFAVIENRWNHLTHESKDLKSKLEAHMPQMREGFLLQLLNGYLFGYKETDLEDRLKQFGLQVSDKQFLMIYIQLYGFSKREGMDKKGDEALVTVLAAKAVQEQINAFDMDACVIHFHDFSLGTLLMPNKNLNREEMAEKVRILCTRIITSIRDAVSLEVSIGISRTTDSIKDIPRIFDETKISLSFRNIHDRNPIIEFEKVDLLHQSTQFEYPFETERELTHAIRQRNETEALALLQEFAGKLSTKNTSEALIKQGMLQLLGRILEVEIQSGIRLTPNQEGANLYEQLCQFRDIEEMEGWLKDKVICPLVGKLSSRQDERMKLMIEKVIMVLEEQYYKDDLSLDSCADLVNIHPSMLSKVFKDITGLNFIEYLTHIRLKKAKELLLDTDLKISEVAEQTGYKHSYFNRLFKKHEGYTPGQYRDLNRAHVS